MRIAQLEEHLIDRGILGLPPMKRLEEATMFRRVRFTSLVIPFSTYRSRNIALAIRFDAFKYLRLSLGLGGGIVRGKEEVFFLRK